MIGREIIPLTLAGRSVKVSKTLCYTWSIELGFDPGPYQNSFQRVLMISVVYNFHPWHRPAVPFNIFISFGGNKLLDNKLECMIRRVTLVKSLDFLRFEVKNFPQITDLRSQLFRGHALH